MLGLKLEVAKSEKKRDKKMLLLLSNEAAESLHEQGYDRSIIADTADQILTKNLENISEYDAEYLSAMYNIPKFIIEEILQHSFQYRKNKEVRIPTKENDGDLFWFYGKFWDYENDGLYHVKISINNGNAFGLLHGIGLPFPLNTFNGKWKKIEIGDIEWN